MNLKFEQPQSFVPCHGHLSWWLIASLISMLSVSLKAWPTIDSETGVWTDDYSDNTGIDLNFSMNVVHDAILGTMKVAPSEPTGVVVTLPIAPAAIKAWKTAKVEAVLAPASGGFLGLDVLDESGNPLPGLQGLNASDPVSLESIQASAISIIRLRITLQAGDEVTAARVRWEPKAAVTASVSAPAFTSGLFECKVILRPQIAQANNLSCKLVLTPPLPAYPGQQLIAEFVSASDRGRFTSSPATITWDMGVLQPSEPHLLRANLRLPQDIRHDQSFSLQATVWEGDQMTTVSSPITVTAQVFPSAYLSLEGGDNVLQTAAGEVVLAGNAPQFKVKVTLPNETPDMPSKLVAPVVFESLTNWMGMFTLGPETLTISDGGRFEAAYVPPQGGAPRPAVVWDLPPLRRGDSWIGSYRPALPSEAFDPGSVKFRQANLYAPELSFSPAAQLPVRLGPLATMAGTFEVGDFGHVSAAQDATDQFARVGDPLPYHLRLTNRNLVVQEDAVLFARVPANCQLLDWETVSGAGAIRFYSTTTDPAYHAGNPPPIEVPPGSADINPPSPALWLNWEITPPTDFASVTWVAVLVPRLDSIFDPAAEVTTAEAVLTVEPLPSAIPSCGQQGNLVFTGLTKVFRKSPISGGTTMPADGLGAWMAVDYESTQVRPPIPLLTLSSFQRVIEPQSGTAESVRVRMSGAVWTDDLPATQTTLTLSWNLGISPETSPPIDTVFINPAAGSQVHAGGTGVTLALGDLAAEGHRNFTVVLEVPAHLAAEGYPRVKAIASADGTVCAAAESAAFHPSQGEEQARLLVSMIDSPPFINEGGSLTQRVLFVNGGTQVTTQTLGLVRLSPRSQLHRIDAAADLQLRGYASNFPGGVNWFEVFPGDLEPGFIQPDWVADATAPHGGYWTLPPATQWLVILPDHPDTGQWLPGRIVDLSWTVTHADNNPLESERDFVLLRTEAFLTGVSFADPSIKAIARSGNRSVVVSPTADSDGDGLPDALEFLWFGSLDQTGEDDNDGDGFSNLTEWLLGTAPHLSESRPRINLDMSDPNWFRFEVPAGQDDRLTWQFSHSLEPDSWVSGATSRWSGQGLLVPRDGKVSCFIRTVSDP